MSLGKSGNFETDIFRFKFEVMIGCPTVACQSVTFTATQPSKWSNVVGGSSNGLPSPSPASRQEVKALGTEKGLVQLPEAPAAFCVVIFLPRPNTFSGVVEARVFFHFAAEIRIIS